MRALSFFLFTLTLSAQPEYKTLPAAAPHEFTPALPAPRVNPSDWPRSHGDAASARFSPLTQITRANVARLAVAWEYHSNDATGNIQCNPVIVDGVLYAPTPGNAVVAVDAATGRERWRFRPEGRPAHRGLLFHKGRLYFPSGNWLYVLDAATGRQLHRLAAGGVTAPAIFANTLVVAVENRVLAFDIRDGKPLWTFHAIPRPGEFGHDTWRGADAAGVNIWGGIALDASRGIAYVATGSPHPNFIGVRHLGDNLFSNSVIALDVRTGKRLWHFQEIAHDIWDLDIPAPPVLVTVTRHGRKVDAVAQVTKLGNTLLLDRLSGKPLFPYRLRRAPASNLPGEQTAPFQPDLDLPEPFARQTFSKDLVTNRTPAARASVLKQLERANTGWFAPFEDGKPTAFFGVHGGAEWTGASFDPATGLLYVSSNEIPWIITVSRAAAVRQRSPNPTPGERVYRQRCAACHGPAREGAGMAPSLNQLGPRLSEAETAALIANGRNAMPPTRGLTQEQIRALLDYLYDRDLPPGAPKAEGYVYNGYPKLLDHEGYPGSAPPWGTLNAIDLNTGRIAWRVPLGEYAELLPQKTGTENFGGATVTAGGLVFCAGTRDRKIRAFDAATGEELWSHTLPFYGSAPPAVYAVNGRQYVVIAATGGGKLGGPTGDSYVAFALPTSPAR